MAELGFNKYEVLKGDGIERNVPIINTGTGSDNPVRLVVKNGIGFIYLRGVGSSSSSLNNWYTVAGPIPPTSTGIMLYTASLNQARLSIISGKTYIEIYKANTNPVYGTMVYPIDNSWDGNY